MTRRIESPTGEPIDVPDLQTEPASIDAEEARFLTRWTGCPFTSDESTDAPTVIDDAMAEDELDDLLQHDLGGSD